VAFLKAEQVVMSDPQQPGSLAVELQALLLDADGIESFVAEVARRAAGTVDRAQSCG
jgi:hypothetical protein